MIILAHRGLWRQRGEQNSMASIEAAFRSGFGVETDIRDRAGEVVVSHDPPGADALPSLGELLELSARNPGRTIALNIKSDGLQAAVAVGLAAVAPRVMEDVFLFDMSVPDALSHIRRGLPCFTRQSEYEPYPSFPDRVRGVWMDCFDGDWIGIGDILSHIDAGRHVALVSPELHGRDPARAWEVWREADRLARRDDSAASVMICTDYPEKADGYFN